MHLLHFDPPGDGKCITANTSDSATTAKAIGAHPSAPPSPPPPPALPAVAAPTAMPSNIPASRAVAARWKSSQPGGRGAGRRHRRCLGYIRQINERTDRQDKSDQRNEQMTDGQTPSTRAHPPAAERQLLVDSDEGVECDVGGDVRSEALSLVEALEALMGGGLGLRRRGGLGSAICGLSNAPNRDGTIGIEPRSWSCCPPGLWSVRVHT